jgi:hypothetical protein
MKKIIEVRQIYINDKLTRELVSSASLMVFMYSILIFFLNEFYGYDYFQISFEFSVLFLMLSIYTGTRNYQIFDFETGTIESISSYGILKKKKVLTGDHFDYLSLAKQQTTDGDIYDLNIWRKDNTHQRFYTLTGYSQAMAFSMKVSETLDLKLLDATDMQDTKWVTITKA